MSLCQFHILVQARPYDVRTTRPFTCIKLMRSIINDSCSQISVHLHSLLTRYQHFALLNNAEAHASKPHGKNHDANQHQPTFACCSSTVLRTSPRQRNAPWPHPSPWTAPQRLRAPWASCSPQRRKWKWMWPHLCFCCSQSPTGCSSRTPLELSSSRPPGFSARTASAEPAPVSSPRRGRCWPKQCCATSGRSPGAPNCRSTGAAR